LHNTQFNWAASANSAKSTSRSDVPSPAERRANRRR